MSRLILPESSDINIWNTSNVLLPANMAHIRPSNASSPSHFTTINLDPVHSKGIFFFIDRGLIIGIHMHAEQGSSALYTFYYLNSFRPDEVVWIYTPLSTADRVLKIGVRHEASITHKRRIHSIRVRA